MRLEEQVRPECAQSKDVEPVLECGGEMVWNNLYFLLWEILLILISSSLT